MPSAPRELAATVAATRPATHDIRIIELSLPPGGRFDFKAGQYAKLGFAGHPLRDYSMASRPGARLLEFHIRDMGDGPSRHAVRQVQVGDAVRLAGPFGDAWLRPDHRGPIIGIAGGSGLAPVKSIVEAALDAGATQPVHLYFGARAARDLYLTDHFAALMRRHGNFRFVRVLSEPEAGSPHRRGLVGDAVAADFTSFAGCKAYL
ncbi:MAG: FAD-binding oxidoreductase, partial [Dongiaceae bacterium]